MRRYYALSLGTRNIYHTDADFTGLKGELLYEYYMCQEGGNVTRTVTAKEVAGWLHEVALRLGKHKLAGEANTYAKRLVEAS